VEKPAGDTLISNKVLLETARAINKAANVANMSVAEYFTYVRDMYKPSEVVKILKKDLQVTSMNFLYFFLKST